MEVNWESGLDIALLLEFESAFFLPEDPEARCADEFVAIMFDGRL